MSFIRALDYTVEVFLCVCIEDIELQPLNGQRQSGAAPDASTSVDAVDVVVLDGKQKHPESVDFSLIHSFLRFSLSLSSAFSTKAVKVKVKVVDLYSASTRSVS